MFTPPNVSHVKCHVSRVTCHVSHVTCHMLFFFVLFFDKMVKPIGGGSVINGAYLVYLNILKKFEILVLLLLTAHVKRLRLSNIQDFYVSIKGVT